MIYSVSVQADIDIEVYEELDLEDENAIKELEVVAAERLREAGASSFRILDIY